MTWEKLVNTYRKPLSDFLLSLPRDFEYDNDCKNIVVFSAPKSASSFITNTLSELLDFERAHLANADETDIDHRLDAARILYYKLNNIDTLSQHHTIASTVTVDIIKRLPVIPIVTTRGIVDSLLSYRNMLDRQRDNTQFRLEKKGFQFKKTDCFNDYKTTYFIKNYFQSSPTKKLDFLIDQYANWYFQFILSWRNLAEKGFPMILVNYNDLLSDALSVFRKIVRFSAYTPDAIENTQIERAMCNAKTNLTSMVDQGQSKNRGIKHLTSRQIDRLVKIGCYHEKEAVIRGLL